MKDDSLVTSLKKRNKFLEEEYAKTVKTLAETQVRLWSETEAKEACSKCLEEERIKNRDLESRKCIGHDVLLHKLNKKLDSAIEVIKWYSVHMEFLGATEKAREWLKENE